MNICGFCGDKVIRVANTANTANTADTAMGDCSHIISGYTDIQLEVKSQYVVLFPSKFTDFLNSTLTHSPWEPLDPRWRTSAVSPVYKL